MNEFLTRTPGDVFAEVSMTLTTSEGVNLLVEGDADSRFWRAHANLASCHIVICRGKLTAVRSAEMLSNAGIRLAFGIVDDDLDSLLGISLPSPNLSHTDGRDLEAMILESPALEKALDDLADRKAEFEKTHKISIRTALEERGLAFGELRYYLASRGIELKFDRFFSPYRYINETNWFLDRRALYQDFCSKLGITEESLMTGLADVQAAPPWKIIHGHDAESILHIGLTAVLSSTKLSKGHLSSALRIAFDRTMLHRTRLCANLRAWEAKTACSILQNCA